MDNTSPLKDFKPTDILISNDSLQNILQNYEQQFTSEADRKKYKDLTISTIVTIIANVISVATVFSSLDEPLKWLVGIIAVALIIYTTVCASRWHVASKQAKQNSTTSKSLENQIFDKVQHSMRYTAIIRVTNKQKDGMRYLVGDDYFLPHCRMDPRGTIDAQSDSIIQCLHDDFSIQEKDIVLIKPVDGQVHFSIKPIHDKIQMNAYVFYDVEIKVQSRKKLLESTEKRKWISLEKMKRTPDALATNKDVIDLLSEFPKPKESFVNLLGNINVIWNITSHCDYNCGICATHDEKRSELDATDKLTVWNNITTAKSLIKTLDFAGGDPLYSDETINIIRTAISQLGADKVSVTTTGTGISKLTKDKFPELIKHCEITIDAAHSNLGGEAENTGAARGEDRYCSTNLDHANLIFDYAESLTVNIPIINDDLNDDEINTLVSEISWIKEHNPRVEIDALLIRLMPVGKLSIIDKETYQNYNPIDTANKIRCQLAANSIACRLHCSLRVLPCFHEDGIPEQHCSMLENKIGIDCAGNVFACAWGGYLYGEKFPIKNPFYLGNLTQKSLRAILEGEVKSKHYQDIFSEIDSKQKRHFCSVISYFLNEQLFQDFDSLSAQITNRE